MKGCGLDFKCCHHTWKINLSVRNVRFGNHADDPFFDSWPRDLYWKLEESHFLKHYVAVSISRIRRFFEIRESPTDQGS